MTTTRELHPVHEDATVAAALGRLLVRREAPDPEPFDAVADRSGVDPVRLETAVYRLGVESEIDGLPGRVDPETVSHRTTPAFLADRTPVVRERDGVRDPEARARVDPRITYKPRARSVHVSLGIGHFAVGAAGGLAVLLVTGLHRKTAQDGIIAILSGLWAMLPDLGVVVSGLGPTDHTPLANLFWFHYVLDTRAFTDSLTGSAALVGLLVVAMAWLVLTEGNDENVEDVESA